MATKKIDFILNAEVVGNASSGMLLGDFNNWNYENGIAMKKQKDGSLKATIALETGKSYQYRFLLSDGRWVNDKNADSYVSVPLFNAENCVINVPSGAPAKKVAETKAAPAAKAATVAKVAAKKTTAAKTEVTKAAAPKATATKKAAPATKATAPATKAPAKSTGTRAKKA